MCVQLNKRDWARLALQRAKIMEAEVKEAEEAMASGQYEEES